MGCGTQPIIKTPCRTSLQSQRHGQLSAHRLIRACSCLCVRVLACACACESKSGGVFSDGCDQTVLAGAGAWNEPLLSWPSCASLRCRRPSLRRNHVRLRRRSSSLKPSTHLLRRAALPGRWPCNAARSRRHRPPRLDPLLLPPPAAAAMQRYGVPARLRWRPAAAARVAHV